MTIKWMTLSVVSVLALLAWATLGEAASIGPGAFGSPTTVTYGGLGLPFFNATPNSRVIVMDNLMKESGSRSVPLPSSFWLLGGSIAVLLVGRSWLNAVAR